MDRYFDESYDPRLDIHIPTVPSTGLINNMEYEGWDSMLELLRTRREDKEEKRRLQSLGYSKSEAKKEVGSSAEQRWNSGGVSALDIQYKKRGAVREWDVGKEKAT